MYSDVIEIAEAVLQALEGGKELPAPFSSPLAREQTGEEFRCVAQLLGLDAQLVSAASRRAARPPCPFCAPCASAVLSCSGGGNRDRKDLAHGRGPARPAVSVQLTRLEPSRDLQPSARETAPTSPHPARAPSADCRALPATSCESDGTPPQRPCAAPAPAATTRFTSTSSSRAGPSSPGQPFQLPALIAAVCASLQDTGEQRHRRAQPAQAHPQLMHALRIALGAAQARCRRPASGRRGRPIWRAVARAAGRRAGQRAAALTGCVQLGRR